MSTSEPQPQTDTVTVTESVSDSESDSESAQLHPVVRPSLTADGNSSLALTLTAAENLAIDDFYLELNRRLRESHLNPQTNFIEIPYRSLLKSSPDDYSPQWQPQSFYSLFIAAPDYLRSFTEFLRFLRSREFHVLKSLELYASSLAWRAAFRVDEITLESVSEEMKSNKAYWLGHDAEGRPALIIRPVNHRPSEIADIQTTLRFAIFILESGMELLRNSNSTNTNNSTLTQSAAESASSSSTTAIPVSQLVLIYDRTGMSRANFDRRLLSLMSDLAKITQDFYGERLYKAYIFPVNWFYWAVSKLLSPFLAAKTKEKFKILGSAEELLTGKYFNSDGLSTRYGGTLFDQIFQSEQEMKEK